MATTVAQASQPDDREFKSWLRIIIIIILAHLSYSP